MGRIYNSKRNISFSFISYVITIFLEFLNRTLFIHFLSQQYLGIQGLFGNILSFLSLADLGIGSAMSYALYEPLAEKNIEKIKSIMALYKKLYVIIGFVVLGLGVVLVPFIKYFIKDFPNDIPHIYYYYLLYVVNSGISYFLVYKKTLIISSQKEYIPSIISSFCSIVRLLLQIVVLAISKMYGLYLIVIIFITITENTAISFIANKKYPYIKDKNCKNLDIESRTKIQKNVYAMFFHKVGTVVVNATDNIVISAFIGLIEVGKYSNYTLIINAFANLINKVFSSLTASIGNLTILEDKNYSEDIFYKILFSNAWLRIVPTVCILCLINPFIEIWIGKEYLFSQITVYLLLCSFYFRGMRNTVLLFRDATGLFWHDRYKSLVESIVNLFFSVILAIKIGINGVIIGTILSTICVSFWVEPYILFKYFFEKKMLKYMLTQVTYFFQLVVISFCCKYCVSLIFNSSLLSFIYSSIIVFFVSNGLMVFMNFYKKEFKYYLNFIRKSNV